MELSDKNVTLDQVKFWVKDFCEERGWDPYHGPKDLAIGLATESSELLEIFRFIDERKCLALVEDPAKREAIGDELADSLYFILRFAQLYNFDLSECIRNKTKKNAIKYPAPKR